MRRFENLERGEEKVEKSSSLIQRVVFEIVERTMELEKKVERKRLVDLPTRTG